MPFIKRLSISGFCGFSEPKSIAPGVPNGTPGSGLTIIVGPNNAGKSSITEALIAAVQGGPPPFHVGQRNVEAGNRVSIEIEGTDGKKKVVRTVDAGGAPTISEGEMPAITVTTVPARRQFAPAFDAVAQSPQQYNRSIQHYAARQQAIPLHYRLNQIVADPAEKKRFDATLNELMGYTPTWTIEQHETGQNFLKYTVGKHSHSSDGLGDGIISLFSIATSLHDAAGDAVVVIDEPELSLHPQFQRRVIRL